jgi:uncharacterized protein (DUF2235 family)
MSKRIVVLSDGTGNSAAQVWRTNVWRTFESIDLTESDQIAFYDDGVGTSSFKPAAILGGAFGYGLKRNVLALYKFLCRNYKTAADYGVGGEDDPIYAFGFSRGAFTIRILVGLVLEQGLIQAATEAELDRLAIEAYRNYRANNFHTWWRIEGGSRAIRDFFLGREHSAAPLPQARPIDKIRFLGLWDTVAAYGLPVDEMTRGVSRYLWPLELPNRNLDPDRITRACHAICLDDQRTTFHPVLWDESNLPQTAATRTVPYLTSQEKVTQIWFSGVHSNVGGGYPDDSLAYIPFYWILKEAENCLLRFKERPWADPDTFISAQSKGDKDGRLYDSRSGLAGYYRYGPRSVQELCNVTSGDDRDKVTIKRPKIYESVFRRTSLAAHSYAPIGLPREYDVVTFNFKSQSFEILDGAAVLPEAPANAIRRYNDQERIVWSTVWRGRGIYFLTVLASLYLLLYPLALTIPATDEFTTPLRLFSDAIRLVSIPLPNAANRWIDAYARDPALFLIVASAIGLLMILSAGLRARITGQMSNLLATSLKKPNNLTSSTAQENWRPSGLIEVAAVSLMAVAAILGFGVNPFCLIDWLWTPLRTTLSEISYWMASIGLLGLLVLFVPSSRIYALRSSPTYRNAMQGLRLRYAPAFFALSFCVIGFLFFNHYLFDVEDSFGAFCTSTSVDGKKISASGIDNRCLEADLHNCPVDRSGVDGKAAACKATDTCTGKSFLVDTRELCSPTGLFLEKTSRYRIEVKKFESSPIPANVKTVKGSSVTADLLDWRMLRSGSDAGGKTLTGLGRYDKDSCGDDDAWKARRYRWLRTPCNYLAGFGRQVFAIAVYPLKRTFDRPFGTFIVRYGRTGNEENFIDPDLPEPALKKPNPLPGQAPPSCCEETGTPIDRSLDEKFNPTRDGELFVYLNKPTLGLWPNTFYNLNNGIAEVEVILIPPKS